MEEVRFGVQKNQKPVPGLLRLGKRKLRYFPDQAPECIGLSLTEVQSLGDGLVDLVEKTLDVSLDSIAGHIRRILILSGLFVHIPQEYPGIRPPAVQPRPSP